MKTTWFQGAGLLAMIGLLLYAPLANAADAPVRSTVIVNCVDDSPLGILRSVAGRLGGHKNCGNCARPVAVSSEPILLVEESQPASSDLGPAPTPAPILTPPPMPEAKEEEKQPEVFIMKNGKVLSSMNEISSPPTPTPLDTSFFYPDLPEETESNVFVMRNGRVLSDRESNTDGPVFEVARVPTLLQPQFSEKETESNVFIMRNGVRLQDTSR